MEKRAILAIILSFLVLFFWYKFFIPKPVAPVADDKTIEGQVEKQPEAAAEITQQTSAVQTIEDNNEASVLPPPVAETQIVIDTPLYLATFSNRGASITGFKLKKYRSTVEPDSPPVELFTAHEYIKNHISFSFNNPYLKDGNNLMYTTEDESFVLSKDQANKEISFKYVTESGLIIEQIFNFSAEHYDIGLKIKITNQSGIIINGNIKAFINNLRPEEKSRYYSFTGASAYLGNELNEFDFEDLEEDRPELAGDIDWIAYENEYFISAIIPKEKKGAKFEGTLQTSGVATATYISSPVDLSPNTEATKEFYLFLGPRDISILEQFDHNLDRAVDYGFFGIIAGPLHFLLKFFNKFLHNYGLSIILLTIIIKIIFWPLTHKSQKSMKEMQKLQPLMAKIREKYKDNREMMNKELMGLYRTYKVNPMSGCLPMLIQIPVFFALYRVLNSSIELRHAPFALWINDLSAPDRLFSLPSWVPWIEPPGIPVLTLFMGASMFLQQKMQPMVGDPSQAKIMMFMPIMFTVMFINFPSGLTLYWLTQNILSIGQQYYINKKSD